MIDIANEQLLSLTEAAKMLPGRVAVSTLWRWYKNGVGGVRLETLLVGGKRYTSTAALQEFAEKRTAAADGTPPPARTSRQRQKAIAAAETVLQDAGISE